MKKSVIKNELNEIHGLKNRINILKYDLLDELGKAYYKLYTFGKPYLHLTKCRLDIENKINNEFISSLDNLSNELNSLIKKAEDERKVKISRKFKAKLTQFYKENIDNIETSVRLSNALYKNGVTKISDVVKLGERRLLELKYFGRKSLIELNEIFMQKTGLNIEQFSNEFNNK